MYILQTTAQNWIDAQLSSMFGTSSRDLLSVLIYSEGNWKFNKDIMFYCTNILLDLCTNQNTKFENLQSRAKTIIQNEEATCSWKPVEHFRKMYCALEVFKCINNLVPPIFHNYFLKISYNIETPWK